MKTIAWLAGIGTLLAGARSYMVVSLNRWEWNRALFFGLIVLIAEVGLATGLVLRKLGASRAQHPARCRPASSQILRETRPPSPTASRGCRESTETAQRLHHVPRRRRRHPLGRRLGRRSRRVEDLHAGRRGAPGAPARTRSATRRVDCSLDDVTVLAQDVPGADDEQIRKLLRRGGRP